MSGSGAVVLGMGTGGEERREERAEARREGKGERGEEEGGQNGVLVQAKRKVEERGRP